ncbi:hypothetical protein [Lewinella sp. IMCC34191]|uniref:hypothetical protein n=1 Tax=Lewinella sp. IMCC34191 TaxID=2259172 RepID=UPI000E26657F|nr:hypothetical protein [Lewinella sp. IMCC34191]
MKGIYPLLLLTLLAFTGCPADDETGDGDDPTTDEKGDLFVRVTYYGEPVAGAIITTDPPTYTDSTDFTGTVLLQDLDVDSYRILAEKAPMGKGVAAVRVVDDQLVEADIRLMPGSYNSPSLSLYTDSYYIDTDSRVTIRGTVADNSPATAFTIAISSSLDGLLGEVKPYNSGGEFTLEVERLSPGLHRITATTTDEEGLTGSAETSIEVIKLPDPVVLDSVSLSSEGLRIDWQAATEPEFERYTVMRSEYGQDGYFYEIASIRDASTTTYLDTDVTYGTTYHYKIGVEVGNGYNSESNTVAGRYLLPGPTLDMGLTRLVADPQRPYLYGLDRVNNNMAFISLETREVEKTIFVGSSPSDIAFSLDNQQVFIANYGSSQIAVVDLETREKVRDIIVDTQAGSWDGNPYRLAVMAGNRLAYTSEDQWNSVKLVNAENGVHLDDVGSVYQPGLLTNEDGTILYVLESGSSGSTVIRYNLDGNTLVQVDQSNGSSGYGDRDGMMTADGKYIFYNGLKLLANNLGTLVGTFNDEILAATDDGSVVVGRSKVWDGETFAILAELPLRPDLAVIPPGSRKAYLYIDATSQLITYDLAE